MSDAPTANGDATANTNASGICRMNIREFKELGFLQEANRLFFHPIGLALEVVETPEGSMHLGGIWDYRGDPSGIYFDPLDTIEDIKKANLVHELRTQKLPARTRLFAQSVRMAAMDGMTIPHLVPTRTAEGLTIQAPRSELGVQPLGINLSPFLTGPRATRSDSAVRTPAADTAATVRDARLFAVVLEDGPEETYDGHEHAPGVGPNGELGIVEKSTGLTTAVYPPKRWIKVKRV